MKWKLLAAIAALVAAVSSWFAVGASAQTNTTYVSNLDRSGHYTLSDLPCSNGTLTATFNEQTTILNTTTDVARKTGTVSVTASNGHHGTYTEDYTFDASALGGVAALGTSMLDVADEQLVYTENGFLEMNQPTEMFHPTVIFGDVIDICHSMGLSPALP